MAAPSPPCRFVMLVVLVPVLLVAAGCVPAARAQALTAQSVCERPRQALDLMQAEAERSPVPGPPGLGEAAGLARSGAACYGAELNRRRGSPELARPVPPCTLTDYDDSLRSFDLFAPADLPAPDSTWFAVFFATRAFHHLRLGHAARALGDYRTALAYAATRPAWLRAPLVIDAATAHLCVGDASAAREGFGDAARLLPRQPHRRGPYALLRSLADHGAAAALLEVDAPPAGALAEAAGRLERAAAHYAAAGLASLHGAALTLLAELDHTRGAPLDVLADRFTAAAEAAERHGGSDVLVRLALLRTRAALERGAPADVPRVLERAYRHSVLTDRFSVPTLQVLNALGRWHEAQGDLREATAAYERAQRIVEVQRARRQPEAPPLALLAEEQVPFRGRARLQLARGDAAAAFQALEEARGRYLQDLRAHARLAADLEGADRVHYERLTSAIGRVRTELARPRSPAHRSALQGEEARLVLARSDLIRRVTGPPAPTLADVRAHLRRRGSVLVSYFIEEARGPQAAGTYAFVVDEKRLHAVPLPHASRDTLRALVDAVSPALRSPEDGGSLQASRFSLDALHALYSLLVEPLAPHLPAGAPLVVLPEGPLVEVPFGLLLRRPAEDYARADYLLRRHPVSVELAAAFLVEPRHPAGRGLAAFGKTRFEHPPPPSGPEPLSEADLPDAGGEVIAAASRFAGGDVHLNATATEPAFLKALRTASVVHVASHTVVRVGDPARSGVLLTPGDGADGIVYAHELRAADARADLVVLSGCATARGRYRPGEGMAGLHYALRAGGVPATVATLWRVDDGAMRRVLSSFYGYLAEGRAKDEALRQAQLDYLADAGPVAASPYFWAAPVLFGDAAPHHPAARMGSVALSPAVLLAALLLIGLGARLGARARGMTSRTGLARRFARRWIRAGSRRG